MSFYSVGFRRSRNGQILDVTYPVIKRDDVLVSELKELLKVTTAGVHP